MSLAGKRLLGAGMILGVIAIVVLGVTKPNPFKDTRSYWAEFDTAQGLGAIARDVRVAGVRVGTIGTVEREGDNVRAELILFEDVPMHVDARADMRPHTLFEGSNFVDLYPGSPSAPVLELGGLIPIEQTTSYVTLDEALRVLKPEIRNALRDLATVGAKTFRDEAIFGIQRTLEAGPGLTRHLEPAARALQGSGRRELAGAITGISDTVDAVADEEGSLAPLVSNYNRTATAVTVDGGEPLDATLAAMPAALQELYETSPPVAELIRELATFSDQAVPALPPLATALTVATPVLERAVPVLNDATPLVHDTRLLVRRLAEAGPGLTTMLSRINEALVKGEGKLDLLSEPSELGQPAATQFLASLAGGNDTFSQFVPGSPGHIWRIGSYVQPTAAEGLGSLLGGALSTPVGTNPYSASCADIARFSPKAAELIEPWGGCQ